MSFYTDALGDALKVAGKEFKSAISNNMAGKKANGTRTAINHISNNYFGAAEAATRFLGKGEGFGEALVKTFGKGVVEEVGKDGTRKFVAKEGYNAGKIAGSFIGAAAAGRIISGGGITRDKNGNANLIGVPFV